MLRSLLDKLYLASGVIAGFFLAAIAVVIGIQVVGRFWGFVFDSTEISGFFMAASTFLGLGYTFRQGGHVRVTLAVHVLKPAARRVSEFFCCLFGAALLLYLTWLAGAFAHESFTYGDISPGLMAVPFWIPQSGMALGLLIMSIALIDSGVEILQGKPLAYDENVDAV